jgi:hypothetical protein
MSTSSNRKGGGGSVTVGGAVGGGTANRLLRTDASGNLDSWIGAQTDSSGRVCFGGSAGAAPNAARAEVVPAQVRASTAGNQVGFFAENTSVTGAGGGYMAASNSGADLYVLSYSGSAGGNYMGASYPLAGVATIRCSAQLQVFTHAGDLHLGAANAHHIELDGSGGTGIILSKATTRTPTALTGAAIAATSTVGLGSYHFSAPGANRAHTLVSRASVAAGYRVTYTLVGATGGFAIALTRNGTDTILGGTSTYDLDVAYESVTLEACGTNDWFVQAKS